MTPRPARTYSPLVTRDKENTPMTTTWKPARPAADRFAYKEILAASEKTDWRVEDIVGDGKRLDFSKPFLPEALARVERLPFLGAYERLRLNQIRGNEYLC